MTFERASALGNRLYFIGLNHYLDPRGTIAPERGPASTFADFPTTVVAHASDFDRPDETAATVQLKLGDADAAEEKFLANPGGIYGGAYGSLVPLAKALRNQDCPRGETVIYRALLNGIRDRAYARAYGHAARYWARLREIANSGVGLLPLSPPDAFESEIRASHARKTAF